MKTFEEFYSQAKEAQSLNEMAAAPIASVAGKSLGARLIPGVGFVLGAADTANRLSKGDWEGAAYSGLGAAANILPPGVGTAAQLAITGVQQARDYQRGTGEFAKGGAFSQFSQKPTQPPTSSQNQNQNQNPQQSLSLQNRSTLKPITPSAPVTKQQISQQSGLGGKVTTNTTYQSKLGGVKATTTYGSGGQQMVRANLGNQGINKVSSGQVSANKSYGATLGGVKGIVKYDATGNKQFQTLKPNIKPISQPQPRPTPPQPRPQQKKFFGIF
jgi:hypothetical protein